MRISSAFTLVEILIVVIILGILAAVIIPQLSTASTAARHSMLADDVRISRTQVEVFKCQHRGVPPGYPDLDAGNEPTEAAFIQHMTQATTFDGLVAAPGTEGFGLGPYMAKIPENPVNGLSTVQVVGAGGFPDEADDSHGWIFQPSTMMFRADAMGTFQSGEDLFDF